MLISRLGIALANFLIPLAQSFGLLLLLSYLPQGSNQFLSPGSHRLDFPLEGWFRPGTRWCHGRIQSGSGNLGALVAFIYTGYLAQHFGWKTPLYLWSLISLVMTEATGVSVIKQVSSGQETKPDLSAANWTTSPQKDQPFDSEVFHSRQRLVGNHYFCPIFASQQILIFQWAEPGFISFWIGLGTVTGSLYGLWSRRFGRKRVFWPRWPGPRSVFSSLAFPPIRLYRSSPWCCSVDLCSWLTLLFTPLSAQLLRMRNKRWL